ncbi:RidA family protein [Caldibacillus thermolactis]|jgi:2-iminobutanoate/2-iminopropanoate deaminase|uniref:RidA family protein n=1 Tax=Pallidibacillus thermolactis TaxID=251051 RepID=A0ABT2WI00_9BACI|nr:RidA family protein [Pallidibacillus thermolactis]MCU9595313.1 RidA family protein [Pallidibacillus thermolactis]
MFKKIETNQAPKAIGPYSQGVEVGNFLFLSGQIPVNPETNEVVEKDIVAQTNQVMKNISAILESEGLTLNNVVKTTIFLADMEQFATVNEEYAKHLGDHRPARSTIEVSRLPKDVLIEIEVIAARA